MGIGLGRGSRGGDTTENPPSMGMSFLGHNLPEHEKKPTPKKQTIIQLIHSLKVVRRYQYYGYHSTPDLFIECRYFNPNHSSRIRTTLMRGMSEHALHSSVPRPDQTRVGNSHTRARTRNVANRKTMYAGNASMDRKWLATLVSTHLLIPTVYLGTKRRETRREVRNMSERVLLEGKACYLCP